jgi:hypothetical protein
MSDAVRMLGDDVGAERRGAERAERESRGPTSSGGPRGRLWIYVNLNKLTVRGRPTNPFG